MDAICETPLRVAVITAEPLAVSVPAEAEKVAADCPLATVTEAGTVRLALLSERLTAVLLETALERFTVHVAEPLELRVEGEQAREVRVASVARVMVAVRETPLRVAVTVADPSAVSVPVVAENVAVD